MTGLIFVKHGKDFKIYNKYLTQLGNLKLSKDKPVLTVQRKVQFNKQQLRQILKKWDLETV